MKKVYGIEAHDYPKRKEVYGFGKEMAYDLSKYGPFGRYAWRVPFEHLDKEGAREWLRFYFKGDGTLHKGDLPTDISIRAHSVNKQGLEEVRILLENEFGIRSYVYLHPRERSEATKNWSDLYELEVPNVRKFRDEIGFVSPEKRGKLDNIIKRFWGE